MKEISNSTLALMVVAAILVSVVGSFISVSKLNQVVPVGFATTDTGYANLSVPATAGIILNDERINLNTIANGDTNASYNVNDYWLLNNNGGVNVSVELYGQQQGGTGKNYMGRGPFTDISTVSGCLSGALPHTCFKVNCNTTESGYCNTAWESLGNESGAGTKLLQNFDSGASDDAWFGVNVTVPVNEQAGQKEQTVTFFAECNQSSGCV